MTRRLAMPAIALVGGLLCTTGAFAATVGTQASVIAMSQKPKADAVHITYAFAPKDGTLAIYSSGASGRQGNTPIGEVSLSAGDHRDVSVKLKEQPAPGAKLWAVVEQAKTGKPFKNMDGTAEQSFKVL